MGKHVRRRCRTYNTYALVNCLADSARSYQDVENFKQAEAIYGRALDRSGLSEYHFEGSNRSEELQASDRLPFPRHPWDPRAVSDPRLILDEFPALIGDRQIVPGPD